MTKEVKTQWHPAFCSAMKLELIEDDEYLDYTSEYNLNTRPLEIDLLIVKKSKDIEVKNEIGKIFRKHNIIEYKSPDDSMNVNTYLKVNAYACLYKAYEEHVDDIALDENVQKESTFPLQILILKRYFTRLRRMERCVALQIDFKMESAIIKL